MKTYLCFTIITSALSFPPLLSQPRTLSIEELPLGYERAWQNPTFSPDGRFLFYTTENFHGIWELSLETRTSRQITSDPHSGFGFSVSTDGKSIAYRTTTILPSKRRKQEIVITGVAKPERNVVDSGEDLSNPAFTNRRLVFTKGGKTQERESLVPADEIQILGIENTKIVLQRGVRRVLLDPFGGGSYIWPFLSPDRKLIVAYEMDRGAFVTNLEGDILAQLGRRDAPSWTHDGKWIAFMDEQDDGHQILASEILLISPDGKNLHQLTSTPDRIELNPQCSPTEKKIAYNTLDGKIFILTYTEDQ